MRGLDLIKVTSRLSGCGAWERGCQVASLGQEGGEVPRFRSQG